MNYPRIDLAFSIIHIIDENKDTYIIFIDGKTKILHEWNEAYNYGFIKLVELKTLDVDELEIYEIYLQSHLHVFTRKGWKHYLNELLDADFLYSNQP